MEQNIISFIFENASRETWAEFFLGCAAVAGCCYLIYREKDLIKFERKVWKYTKAFVKAVVYTVAEKLEAKKTRSRTSK